ncbi:hypothetical protein KSS87_007155 [Heliosperma pusillum]|nr:hypothetical protein KSS87_007155 [Heliosperma pusillum]
MAQFIEGLKLVIQNRHLIASTSNGEIDSWMSAFDVACLDFSTTRYSILNFSAMQVLVVRQDLKMGPGKIASQCAHAAMGMYAELMQSQRSLLRQWEQCGQAKIVVTCKNLKELTKLEQDAETIGLPTFVVADAGRTQVAAGSKTVLAIGPGRKTFVDSVTGKQRLL